MSMSKRLLFDNNSLDDEFRERMRADAARRIAEFPFRIAGRKRNAHAGRYWDPLWPLSISAAADELGIETITVNGGICVRTDAEKNRLAQRALEILRTHHDQHYRR